MRKLLFILLIPILALASCSSDNEKPTGDYTIKVAPNVLLFGAQPESKTQAFNIVTTGEWQIEYSDAKWLTISSDKGVGGAQIEVVITNNDSKESRELELTVKSPDASVKPAIVYVKQDGVATDSHQSDLAILKKVLENNGNHGLDWVIDGSDEKELKWMSGTGVLFELIDGEQRVVELDCSDANLRSLDVTELTKLTSLSCNGNQLEILDITNNLELIRLSCGMNNLSSIDLSRNHFLEVLHCFANNITDLDVSANAKLATLRCEDNRLTSLDLVNNSALTVLHCENNNFAEGSVKVCIDLLEMVATISPGKEDVIYKAVDCSKL